MGLCNANILHGWGGTVASGCVPHQGKLELAEQEAVLIARSHSEPLFGDDQL